MKFGKQLQEEMQLMRPEWQRYVIPYKSLKKALKREGDYLTNTEDWAPLLATLWSDRIETLTDICQDFYASHPEMDKLFYSKLSDSLVGLRIFLDQAFLDTKTRINTLKDELSRSTNPFEKDFLVWKKILALYHNFDLWDIQTLSQLNLIDYEALKQQFDTFLKRLQKLNLVNKFSLSNNNDTMLMFLEANKQMLSLLRFCELNQRAAVKILKKFNKTTNHNLSLTLVKTDLSPLSSYPKEMLELWWDVIDNTLPRLEDFLCPICMEICWKPTRLRCGHLFCHWCCLHSQMNRKRDCPMCRSPNAMTRTDQMNIDKALKNHLKLYFPDEVKCKKKDQDKELLLNELGNTQGAEFIANASCTIM